MSSSSFSPDHTSPRASRRPTDGLTHSGRRPAHGAAHTGRHAALLAVGAALALVVGACSGDDDEAVTGAAATHDAAVPSTPVEDSEGSDPPRYGRYVALGDSFAAFGPTRAPTDGPASCLRSTRNYPAVLTEITDIGELVDVTCGGARTPDMTSRQIAETPAQFEALTADTDLVTLSIGGNDIRFGDIAGCVMTSPAETGAPCRDRLEMSVTAALDALPAQLDAVYAGIRERSPGARIITTGYMPLVPADGGCDFVSAMAPGDVTWTRHVTERINLLVADAADRARAELALPADADDRHACAPAAQRYTDFTGAATGSHPMHPTAAGQEAMAAAVAGLL